MGLIQYWADAFQGRPQLATVGEVYEELKAQGVEFPPVDLDQLAPVETPSRVSPVARGCGYLGSGFLFFYIIARPGTFCPAGFGMTQFVAVLCTHDIVMNCFHCSYPLHLNHTPLASPGAPQEIIGHELEGLLVPSNQSR